MRLLCTDNENPTVSVSLLEEILACQSSSATAQLDQLFGATLTVFADLPLCESP
jgi:hypothetical protein